MSERSAATTCKECGGKGSLACPGCKGQGRQARSGGAGKLCPDCHGRGTTVCPMCKGTKKAGAD
jgi:DnaJ-class molecular chaperone